MAVFSFYCVAPQVSYFLLHKYTHNLQLNYIEVEVTSGHQKPESDAQWQSEDPGCVEYSIVTPEADLQD